MIVSFDVGINNTAFCEAYQTKTSNSNGNKVCVTRWIRDSISPNTVADTTQAEAVAGLSVFLKKHFDSPDWCLKHGCDFKDVQIIIERQVPLNLKAFVLSYVIMGHFIGMGMNPDQIRMWDPRLKPLPVDAEGKKRKKVALVQPIVDALIMKRCENADECIGMYLGEKKKDDLFDAFLQLMSVLGEKGDRVSQKQKQKKMQKEVKIKVEKVEMVKEKEKEKEEKPVKRQKTGLSPFTPPTKLVDYITID